MNTADVDEIFGAAIPLRVLIFDVETAPLHSYHWQVWKENIQPGQLQNRTWLICWAARWQGQKTIRSDAVTPAEALAEDDSRVAQSLADLVRQADVILAHNVDRFDLPVLNTRLLDLRLEPLPPVRTIDTLKIAKRSFRFTYNRLAYLADFLGIESKHGMQFADWMGVVRGDRKAIAKMRSYCRQDINVLEQVWEQLQPYAKGTPRLVKASHEMQRACPHCGAGFESLKPSGTHRTNASDFQRYKCDMCGKFSRTRSAAKGTKLSLHPL